LTILNQDHLQPPFSGSDIDYREHFTPHGHDIYSAQIFTDVFCEHILDRIRAFNEDAKTDIPDAVNSMHENAVLSKQLGITSLVNSFIAFFNDEIAPQILPERLKLSIDGVHSYVVRYGQLWDQDLGFHVDESFLTLNICLNDTFSGSELIFKGERCPRHIDTSSSPDEQFSIPHKKGRMIIHPGKNRHYVKPISSGERYNLIIWCHNEAERQHWFNSIKTRECLDFCGMSI